MFFHTAAKDHEKGDDRCLYNLYRYLHGDVLYAAAPMVYGDGLIQTAEGCFRLGYAESTRTFFLFYGLNTEDLAVVRDKKSGELVFKNPGSMYLVRGLQSLADDWIKDGKLLLDATWVPGEIQSFLKDIPRIMFHEGLLHQLTPTESCSVFVGYNVQKAADGSVSIDITTKGNKHHLLAGVPPRLFGGAQATAGAPTGFLKRMRDRLADAVAPRLRLSVQEMIKGNGLVSHDQFDPDGIGSLMAQDFASRRENIRKGLTPVSFKKAPKLWFARASEELCDRVIAITEEVRKDFGSVAREIGLHAAHFAISLIEKTSPLTTLLDKPLSFIFNYGKREDLNILRGGAKVWRPLIRNHEQPIKLGRSKIKSELHEAAATIDPSQMGDIKPIDLRFRHNIRSTPLHPLRPVDAYDRDRVFRLWLLRNLILPDGGTFRYLDAKGQIVDPRGLTPQEIEDKIKLVRLKTDDGVILHYLPEMRKLFAFYHKPSYQGPSHLPRDAAAFFKPNEMIQIDLSDPANVSTRDPLVCLPFSDACAEIRKQSNIERFAVAATPARELCGTGTPIDKMGPTKISLQSCQAWSCEMP